jgi:hypothetical protein
MFTLGDKILVIDDNISTTITSDSNVLTIQGFGSFHKSDIVSAFGNNYSTGYGESAFVELPSATDIGIETVGAVGEQCTFILEIARLNSGPTRTKPYLFYVELNGNDSSIEVAAKLNNALVEYNSGVAHDVTESIAGKTVHIAQALPFSWYVEGNSIAIIGNEDVIDLGNFLEIRLYGESQYISKVTLSKFLESPIQANGTPDAGSNTTGDTSIHFASSIEGTIFSNSRVTIKNNLGVEKQTVYVNAVDGDKITISSTLTSDIAATDVIFVSKCSVPAIGEGKELNDEFKMNYAAPYSYNPINDIKIDGKYTIIQFKVKRQTDYNKLPSNHKHLALHAPDVVTPATVSEYVVLCNEDADAYHTEGRAIVLFLVNTAGISISNFKTSSRESSGSVDDFIPAS